MRIALVEDDIDQVELMGSWLEKVGHDVVSYADGADFVRATVKESYDLAVLDWMLPNMNGIEVLKLLRSKNNKTPVLFVTAKDTERDIVEALESGADDYMSKPVTESETNARINALLRRSGALIQENQVQQYDPYTLDAKSRVLLFRGEEMNLTQKEFELIAFLFRNEGKVISRGHLLQVVWGTNPQINTRTVDTHISRLRSKLEINLESTGWELKSIYQHGYRLEKVST